MRWLLALAATAASAEPTCSLNDGQTQLCRSTYLATRIAASALPAPSLSYDGTRSVLGVVWELSFDLPRPFWPAYFRIGSPIDEAGSGAPSGQSAFELNVTLALAAYPGSRADGRLTFRSRLISLAFPESPALSHAHLTFGLGGYINRFGVGPRAELRLRIGHVAWGGLVLACGYQPHVLRDIHLGDFSIGLEAPWVWWW